MIAFFTLPTKTQFGLGQVARKILISVLAISCLALGDCRDKTSPSPIVETRISILQINLRGIFDVPFGDSSENWKERYKRIGADLGRIGAVPDVIALQEIPGWVWCPDNFNFIKDYEPLSRLLAILQARVGVRYRIAYMQTYVTDHRIGPGASVMGGNAQHCRAASGLALLYDPNRIRNVMADTPQPDADAAFSHNHDRNGPYVRRSLPCCSPQQGQEDVCTLIDAPIQNDKCPSKPAGLAWTAVGGIAVARLALRRDNTEFRVYNVHLAFDEPGRTKAWNDTRSLIQSLETDQQLPRWIPPIIVGDFNTEKDPLVEWLTDFDWRGQPEHDKVIHTFTGNAAAFSSRATIVSHNTIQMPSGTTTAGCQDAKLLWSDHCGALTTLVIQEPR